MKIEEVTLDQLAPKLGNVNTHPQAQIDRLAKIIEYQGFRRPIIVSNQSGEIVCGHGRYEAAKTLKLKTVPVIFQDYETPEQEYADHVADNSLQLWSELDLGKINLDVEAFGSDLDVDMLGLHDIALDFEEHDLEDKTESSDKPQEFKVEVICVNSQEMTDLANELTARGMIAKAIFRG